MNGSTENRTSGASEQRGGQELVLTWATAHRMLPLVQRIVEDVVSQQRVLARLRPEKLRLDRQRRTLAWPERWRRYELQEEIANAEQWLEEALAELEVLGVILLDVHNGQVGFPTMVNNQRAFFSWRPGEPGLDSWHFATETARRPVPATWTKPIDSRSRSR